MGPGRRQIGAEAGVGEKTDGDHRQYPTGGAPGRFENQEHRQGAKNLIHLGRHCGAINKLFEIPQRIGDHGDAGERQEPVMPGNRGSIGAAMGRIDQKSKRQREAEENQPQHLRGDARPRPVEKHQRHADGERRRDFADGAGQMAPRSCLFLDESLRRLDVRWVDGAFSHGGCFYRM